MTNYGSVAEGNTFYAARLHSFDWDNAIPADKLKALVQASELIDQFDYLGQKYAVQQVIDAQDDYYDWCTDEAQETLRTADLSQELQFPRGSSNTVPTEIEHACYLIAKALLSGRDPEADLENLAIRSSAYGGVRTTYQREGNNQSHISHLIPSPQAFNLICPFFRERDAFDVKRVS